MPLPLRMRVLFFLACTPISPFVESGTTSSIDSATTLESIPSSDTDTADTTTDQDDEAIYQAFFDPATVQEVRIELAPAAINSLNQDGSTYVKGNVIVNGVRMDDVGVRLKGSSTYQDFNGKPAFKIKTNSFVPGQKYGDLERITLNNMIGDPTQAKEVLVYQLWANAGMTGPRCNFARVYVNDELFGLYSNIESMDDHWLVRRYDDATGDLWGTSAGGADFNAEGLVQNGDGSFLNWILKSGVGSQDAFFGIQGALPAAASAWDASLTPYIDTDQYLDFWAWSVVFGNQDGYPFHTNDVLIYADPSDGGRFDFSPWGMDESYDSTVVWNYVAGALSLTCTTDPACTASLFQKLEADVDLYATFDVDTLRSAAYEVSAADMENDPRRTLYYTVATVNQSRKDLAVVQKAWVQHLRQSLGF